MRRTHPPAPSPLYRLAAVALSAVLALAVLAGCDRSQTDQPGQNENVIPGEATSTATPDTDDTRDEDGEDSPDDEGAESVRPSPPQTIIAPEPEASGSEESAQG